MAAEAAKSNGYTCSSCSLLSERKDALTAVPASRGTVSRIYSRDRNQKRKSLLLKLRERFRVPFLFITRFYGLQSLDVDLNSELSFKSLRSAPKISFLLSHPLSTCTLCGWCFCPWECLIFYRFELWVSKRKCLTSVTPVEGTVPSLLDAQTFTCAEGTACEGAITSTQRCSRSESEGDSPRSQSRLGWLSGSVRVWLGTLALPAMAAVMSQNTRVHRCTLQCCGSGRATAAFPPPAPGAHRAPGKASLQTPGAQPCLQPCGPRSRRPGEAREPWTASEHCLASELWLLAC